MSILERRYPLPVFWAWWIGTCPTWRGSVYGSFPAGLVTPKMASASATPWCGPAKYAVMTAGRRSMTGARPWGRPIDTTAIVGLPTAIDRFDQLNLLGY